MKALRTIVLRVVMLTLPLNAVAGVGDVCQMPADAGPGEAMAAHAHHDGMDHGSAAERPVPDDPATTSTLGCACPGDCCASECAASGLALGPGTGFDNSLPRALAVRAPRADNLRLSAPPQTPFRPPIQIG